jgi:hypothetical protein
VVDEPIAEDVKREFAAQGAYFMNKAEIDAVARVLVTPQRLPNPALVGKAATVIAAKCGISVPPETRVLIAPLDGVGRDYPLSIEKLCPVLRVVRDWREGCERASRSCVRQPYDVDPLRTSRFGLEFAQPVASSGLSQLAGDPRIHRPHDSRSGMTSGAAVTRNITSDTSRRGIC